MAFLFKFEDMYFSEEDFREVLYKYFAIATYAYGYTFGRHPVVVKLSSNTHRTPTNS